MNAFRADRPWLTREVAGRRLQAIPTSPLLLEADDYLRELPAPNGNTVFLHGDVWFGNTLWDHGSCLGLIDWKSAGVGHPGVDLGSLRMRAALAYGLSAADEATTGWEHTAGTVAKGTAYWDAIAAIYTPAGEDPSAATPSSNTRSTASARTPRSEMPTLAATAATWSKLPAARSMPVVAAALHARFGLGSMAAEVRRQRLTDRRREDIVLATWVGKMRGGLGGQGL